MNNNLKINENSVSTKVSPSDFQIKILSKEEYMNDLLMNGQVKVINLRNMKSKPLNLEDLYA